MIRDYIIRILVALGVTLVFFNVILCLALFTVMFLMKFGVIAI